MTATGAPRFRSRLIVGFVLVAALTGALLVAISYALTREHRLRSFEATAEDLAVLSLLTADAPLTVEAFEELVGEVRGRGAFDVVAVLAGSSFTSDLAYAVDDVPPGLAPPADPGEVATQVAEVDGASHLVVAGSVPGPDGPSASAAVLYFFFPRGDVLDGLREILAALAVGWLAAVVGAALVGSVVAGRTLRPVRAFATASRSLAEGLLQTRLAVRDDDELASLAESFNEMAERLEAQMAALARSAERERRFTADVAHELRTPLTGMATAADLLEEDLASLPAQAQQGAQMLITSVRRLRTLVLDLLELARLDAGQEPSQLEPLDLAESVAAVVATWDAGGDVAVDVPPRLVALADRRRLRTVLHNLVGNARQHGGGRVEVRGGPDGDGRVVLEVLDRGPGIPQADLPHVFDRFRKADGSASGQGSGLGLAIALAHAEAQGGRLEAGNRPGGGAAFRLVLPAAPPGGPDPEPDLEPEREPLPAARAGQAVGSAR